MSTSITKITPLEGASQGKESFKIEFSDGQHKVIKSWDYRSLYSYPYLYRKLYCDLLDYKCFEELGKLLLKHATKQFKNLQVLDVACGSGLMGKYLKENSPVEVTTLVGVDVIPEALLAIKRDYVGLYTDCFVADECMDFNALGNYSYNCLSICGGASHIRLTDIKKYINLLSDNAYMVFNLLVEEADIDQRRKNILQWLEEELSFCESKIYNHRRLANGSIVQHEAFLYQKK